MILNIVIAVVGLVAGGLGGYFIFRYVVTGKYNEMISAAEKEADVLKEKKMLEVKEKFLNKKSELEKEVQSRNQKIQQSENRLKQREISLNQRQEELGRRKLMRTSSSSVWITRKNFCRLSRKSLTRCSCRNVPSLKNCQA